MKYRVHISKKVTALHLQKREHTKTRPNLSCTLLFENKCHGLQLVGPLQSN